MTGVRGVGGGGLIYLLLLAPSHVTIAYDVKGEANDVLLLD